MTIAALGEIACYIGFLHIAEVEHNLVDYLVDPYRLLNDALNIGEERVRNISLKYLLVAVELRIQQAGILKPVQLHPDRVRRLPELLSQAAKISPRPRVQKELQEEFEAGFGCD